MEGVDTTPLRAAAQSWSLAGDKQLLDILQNIHQSLVTRCQEVNRKLDEMVTALDDASVDLQNVNNKFMALSNSQFIESRVYDDDTDVAAQEKPKEQPAVTNPITELERLKQSVCVLQSMHEPLLILDSDSESDTDEEITRTVLKPRDLYSDRPLPHIIGSAAWRNKWHAGLNPEDSDSDSSTSKPEREIEQYSDSEPEVEHTENAPSELRISQEYSASSEVAMEREGSPPSPGRPPPAAVAAELARRLGQSPPQIVEQVAEHSPPPPMVRKIYRPEQPAAATIFSDEPPPLNQYQSEGEEYSQEEDDDIFAEFHKPPQPKAHNNREQNRSAEGLFSGLNDVYEESDIFNDFKDAKASPPPIAKQKSTLFEDESEPELFAVKTTKQTPKEELKTEADSVKKPVGGISLFGSNKGAESIGAAILRRNRRNSSSDEDTEKVATKIIKNEEKQAKTTEKDIFDDLFAKSEKEQKIAAKNKDNIKVEKEVKSEKKVDLFSDIFDDIDDIFTTDVSKVTVKEPSKSQKSLFDDDDDLFSDIAVTKSDKPEIKNNKNDKKDLFGSDEDLFLDKSVIKVETKRDSLIDKNSIKIVESGTLPKTQSIFENDSSDNDLFSSFKETKVTSNVTNNVTSEVISKSESDSVTKDAESQLNNVTNSLSQQNSIIESSTKKSSNIERAKTSDFNFVSSNETSQSLFNDNDKDTDDFFNKQSSLDATAVLNNNKNIESKRNKTSLFDDDEDDIFAPLSKSSPESKNNKKVINEKSINNDIKNDAMLTDNNNTKNVPNDVLFDNIESDGIDQTIKPTKEIKESILKHEVKSKPQTGSNQQINEQLFSKTESISTDLPKLENKHAQETNITAKKDNNDTKINTNIMEENLNSLTDIKTVTKSVFDDVVTKPQPPAPDFNNSNNTDNINKELFSPNDSLFNTSNVISNILDDEPPAFEKPKEPKKSKNVNALFEDDSDDEALFFKKNDPLFDEKPDISSDNDALFDIFHDEPPAIDVDFIQKTTKSNNIDDFFRTNSEEDIFNVPSTTKLGKKASNSTSSQTKKNETPKVDILQNIDLNKSDSNKILEQIDPMLDNITAKIDKLESPTKEWQKPDVIDGPNESKKIGKLKSMNFNINVSTLLPGASPKKKLIEQTDGQVISAKSQEDLHSKDKIESVLVKSISFEGESDSKILDNKISKERAKIQVKRRPSSRRARKEAVRKSTIDFGEDSTDNSSSFDDPPGIKKETNDQNDSNKEIENDIESKSDELFTNTNENLNFNSNLNIDPSKQVQNDEILPKMSITNNGSESFEVTNVVISSETNSQKKVMEIPNHPANEVNIPKKESQTDEIKDLNDINTPKEMTKREEIKDVKSKVVYILNDEDIFNTGVDKTIESKKSFNIEDDLFSVKETKYDAPSISTLGSVYKENGKTEEVKYKSSVKNSNNDLEKPKKSLFDDLSDDEDELFNKKITKPKGILDSDSDEDLFGGKSKKKTKVISVKETSVKPKMEVKTSLFDDEDDDDDLFGVKVKSKPASSSQPHRSTYKEVMSKSTEPVFDDPLSLLGDEDN